MDHCRNGHEYNAENTYTYPKTGRRMCRVCHRNTELKRVHANPAVIEASRKRAAAWRINNPDRAKLVRQNWCNSIRKIIADAKSNGCSLCLEKHPACLDFHHRNRRDKKFNIGVEIGSIARSKVVKEITKCDVMCSNCHRKLHWQERNSEVPSESVQ